MKPGARILFVVSEDWMFAVFRLSLARALMARGWEVAVACQATARAALLEGSSVAVFPAPLARQQISLKALGQACRSVRGIVRAFRPDLIQAVALYPVLLAWAATVGLRRPPVVNLITGLGSLFIQSGPTRRLRGVQKLVWTLLPRALRRSRSLTVFQNQEDLDFAVAHRLCPPAAARLIRGSGVDIPVGEPPAEPPATPPVILYAGRLLRDKGILDLLEASRALRTRGVPHRLRLVGECDPGNPTSFLEEEVRQWVASGDAEWAGWRSDVLAEMAAAHVVALPSYREGLPKAILEAGVARRAVVTCDVPGCREVVAHLHNGLLVPPRSPDALARALEQVLCDPELRQALAGRHRERVNREFSSPVVHQEFFKLYAELLAPVPRAPGAPVGAGGSPTDAPGAQDRPTSL